MAKKKASKKAKAVAKPAKKSGVGKRETSSSTKPRKTVKEKSKATTRKKVAPKDKKTAAKPAKKTVAKTGKKVVAKPSKPAAKSSAPKVKDEGRILAESVVNGILEKKGQNIRWLDLRSIENAVCDYFIICEGNSNTQVEAIAESVEEIVKKETGQRPYRSEGWENALWILIDYINVVVHVFERETRYFYNLESLWADAEEIKVKQ